MSSFHSSAFWPALTVVITAESADQMVPEGLENALLATRNERGEVSCERLCRVAERFSVQRLHVAYFADRLGIKIRECSLGAF